LGYCTPLVHDILDRTLPYAVEHRRTHTIHHIFLIGELLGEKARLEALLHFFMDYGIVKEV